jgi:hypothetical protein
MNFCSFSPFLLGSIQELWLEYDVHSIDHKTQRMSRFGKILLTILTLLSIIALLMA